MEITLFAAISINGNAFLYVGLHLQPCVHDEITFRQYQTAIFAETLQISFLCAVDVKMVGICSSDDARIWRQPMERAVELIGLNDNVRTLVA